MKKFINQVLRYFLLGGGITVIGLLLIPTGALTVLMSVIWRTTDRLLRFLEAKENSR